MYRKVGTSVLVYGGNSLLKSMFHGPANILDRAVKDGFDGVQLLPLWFWSEKEIRNIPELRVISFEGSWNQGYLKNTFANKSRLKRDGYKSPIYDIGLFMGLNGIPCVKEVLMGNFFQFAIKVDTMMFRDSLVELCVDNFHEVLQSRCHLTLDIFHILEACHIIYGQSQAESEAMKVIADTVGRCRMIHFQWRPELWCQDLLGEFFAGKGYLYNSLEYLLAQTQGYIPIINEVMEDSLQSQGYEMSDLVSQIRKMV